MPVFSEITVERIYKVLDSLQKEIDDDFRATDDSDDDAPGIEVRFYCDTNLKNWTWESGDISFQDNHYYSYYCSSISLYRDSDCNALAQEVFADLNFNVR